MGISRIIPPPVLLLPVVWQIAPPLHFTPKKSHSPCAYAIFFVPLQPQTQIGLCRHSKKAFIGACFGKQKTGNFLFTRNKRAVNAPWYVTSVVSTTISISAWAFIVCSCERVFQYLCLENKQKEVPRFSFILTGRLEPTSQTKHSKQ